MTNIKHTPGPWHVDHDVYVWSPACIIAAVADRYTPDGAAPANARLIAAAPEMLMALKQAAHEAKMNDGQIWRDTCDKMRAAIAAAEGRSCS